MAKSPTLYTVKYWASDIENTLVSHGILYADSPSDAVAQLEEYYGSDEICSFSIDMLEEGLFEISENERKEFLKRF